MKLSFNLLRPIIFFFCGLGYLPLQSADVGMDRDLAAVEKTETEKNIPTKNKNDALQTTHINVAPR